MENEVLVQPETLVTLQATSEPVVQIDKQRAHAAWDCCDDRPVLAPVNLAALRKSLPGVRVLESQATASLAQAVATLSLYDQLTP